MVSFRDLGVPFLAKFGLVPKGTRPGPAPSIQDGTTAGPRTGALTAAIALELRAGASYGLLVESIAEGGDNRVGLHFCPFLRALGQITMLDHYVNYPEKTKIVTEAALSTQ